MDQRILNKYITVSTNIKQHKSTILEWFLKDHVTLKTEVMTAENSALPSQQNITFHFNVIIFHYTTVFTVYIYFFNKRLVLNPEL